MDQHSRKPKASRVRRRRGANAVEFAMIAFPLTAIVLGTMEYGWFLFNQIMLDSAAREGARVAARTDMSGAEDAGIAAAEDYWASLQIPGVPVFSYATSTPGGVDMIRIDANLTYPAMTGIAPVPGTIEAHVTIRHELQ